MGIGQRCLGERGIGVQAGPSLGQAQGTVLLVAHQRDDRAQGGSPARLGVGPLGLGEIGLGLRDPADAEQQPGPQQKITPIAACARSAPERSTTTGPLYGDDPGHPRLAALGVYPGSSAKERDQDGSP